MILGKVYLVVYPPSSHAFRVSCVTAGRLRALLTAVFSTQKGSLGLSQHSRNTLSAEIGGRHRYVNHPEILSQAPASQNHPRGPHAIFDISKVEKNVVLQEVLPNNYNSRKPRSNLLHKNIWIEGDRNISVRSSISLLRKIVLRHLANGTYVACPVCVSHLSSQSKAYTFWLIQETRTVSNLKSFSFQSLAKLPLDPLQINLLLIKIVSDTISVLFVAQPGFVCVSLSYLLQSVWETLLGDILETCITIAYCNSFYKCSVLLL